MPGELDRLNDIRYALFNTTAPRYQTLILPAFGPLAAELVAKAGLQPGETVLDLGAGTGAVTFAAEARAGYTVGVDFAAAMLAIAQRQKGPQPGRPLSFYQGNMGQLPHPGGTFAVALASFGFNGIDPGQVFPEVLRVLQPGGRLLFQEWGRVEAASQLVKDAVKAHRVKQAEGFLADLRLLEATPRLWDQFSSNGEKIAAFLTGVGFAEVKFWRDQTAIAFDPHKFFHYKTAWAPYQAELNAMTGAERAAVEQEVVDQLKGWTDANGQFIWQPELLRVMAWKGSTP
jgi:ubiquinone/menaquinone biosynthesis C-methylase UbiE